MGEKQQWQVETINDREPTILKILAAGHEYLFISYHDNMNLVHVARCRACYKSTGGGEWKASLYPVNDDSVIVLRIAVSVGTYLCVCYRDHIQLEYLGP